MPGTNRFSEKHGGIAAVVAGVGLIVWSAFHDASLEVIGVVCLLGGSALWARAIHQDRVARRVGGALTALDGRDADLEVLLERGDSLDAIVSDLSSRYRVAREAVLLVATLRLRGWLDGPSPERRAMAGRAVELQRGHASPSAREVLDRLHEDGVGICRDDSATAFTHPPSLSHGQGGRPGTLVLTPFYLFFLPSESSDAAAISALLGEVPGLGLLGTSVDAFATVRDGYRNPFTPRDARSLRARFDRPNSVAVPLGRIEYLRLTTTFAPTMCVDLTWYDESGGVQRRWFDTKQREGISTDPAPAAAWARRWIDRLRLIALAEGQDLPEVTPAARFTFAAATRTSDQRGSDTTPDQMRRMRKGAGRAFLALLAAFAAGTLAILYVDAWIGLAILVVGFVLFAVTAFLAARPGDVVAAALHRIRSGSPETARALAVPGGLAELVRTNHATHAATASAIRLAAAQAMLMWAHSGHPADRRQATAAALAQGGGALVRPAEALSALADAGLYFPGQAAVFDTGTARLAGSVFIGPQYVFFLVDADATPGVRVDAATIQGLARLLTREDSRALPVRDVRELTLVGDEDPALQIDANGSGAADSWLLRFAGARPEEKAGQAGVCMTRIQLAAAAEGNLLCWDEEQPRLRRSDG